MKIAFISTVLLLFIFPLVSSADMKISPDGITSADNTGTLKLSGSISGLGPDGALVSGVNTSNSPLSFGGYFSAIAGRAVFGFTEGTGSYGVYGMANGSTGRGVHGSSSDTNGYGVSGFASGSAGKAVYGKADTGNPGGATNYGGYFEADGGSGTAVYGEATGAAGKGIHGVASNSANGTNYGGYFEASGESGAGVYGKATGEAGKGIHGIASNNGNGTNIGGHFEAFGESGRGIYATAGGATGRGVYGVAWNSGNVSNFGGYFSAAGETGRGVYGVASNKGTGTNYGVFGRADAFSGRGVHGVAQSDHGIGVYGVGGRFDFYAGGGQGSTNYAPFTGAHEVKFSEEISDMIVPGMIVSVTGRAEKRKGENGNIALSSTLPTVTLADKPQDKAVFGVVVSKGPLLEDHWYEAQEDERFGVVNALGEGRVWVTDMNGRIQAGDYITTSSIPGYGQMQKDDILHSYTLGKAIETVDFEQVDKTVNHEGKTYKTYLIAVVYTSG